MLRIDTSIWNGRVPGVGLGMTRIRLAEKEIKVKKEEVTAICRPFTIYNRN